MQVEITIRTELGISNYIADATTDEIQTVVDAVLKLPINNTVAKRFKISFSSRIEDEFSKILSVLNISRSRFEEADKEGISTTILLLPPIKRQEIQNIINQLESQLI